MITLKIQLYKFDELPEAAQKRAIREWNPAGDPVATAAAIRDRRHLFYYNGELYYLGGKTA